MMIFSVATAEQNDPSMTTLAPNLYSFENSLDVTLVTQPSTVLIFRASKATKPFELPSPELLLNKKYLKYYKVVQSVRLGAKRLQLSCE